MVTTTKILADRVLQRACDEPCVDWAIELLANGNEHPATVRLATKLRPHNHFELASLRDQILSALGMDTKTDAEVLIEYATEILHDAAAEKRNQIETITEVKDLCITLDYHEAIYDFYSLYFAWADLQISEVQWYWQGADRSNIESLIHDRILEFARNTQS